MNLGTLLQNSGVDTHLLLLLLFLPVVSTIVAVSRHIVGLKSLSIYAPILLAYAFIEIGFPAGASDVNVVDALKYGTFLFAIVFATAVILYSPLRQMRLHFYPKVSLIYIAVANVLVVSLIFVSLIDSEVTRKISTFSIVLIAAVTERIISNQARKGFKAALLSSLETYLQAVFALLLFSVNDLRVFLLNEPWIVWVLALVNLLVGLFTGLRLTEYSRFYSILNEDEDK